MCIRDRGQERRVTGQVGAQDLDGHGAAEPGVMTGVYLGHSAATDELTDLVTPAQQMRCAVHYLPFFLPLPLPGVGLLGTDDVTEGETTVFAVVGVGVVEVGVSKGMFVPPSPSELSLIH